MSDTESSLRKQRPCIVGLRVSREERESLRTAAKARHMTVDALLRDLIFARDDWYAAGTPAAFAELLHRRDNKTGAKA